MSARNDDISGVLRTQHFISGDGIKVAESYRSNTGLPPHNSPDLIMNNYDFGGSGIDRSMGALFLGLAVTAFIILTVIGMARMQSEAEDATHHGRREAVTEVQSELGV